MVFTIVLVWETKLCIHSRLPNTVSTGYQAHVLIIFGEAYVKLTLFVKVTVYPKPLKFAKTHT